MGSLPSWASQKGFDLLAPVDGTAIPDDQQPHRDVGGQVPQEAGRIPAAEGPVLHPGVQPAMGGDTADHRQVVPAEGHPEHWGLTPGGIGLEHQGQQVAAGLIYKDDGPAFVSGLFSGRASAPLSSAGWPPLAGPPQGLLAAPGVLLEDAPHLGGVVLDPEVASDNLGHPGLGPAVAAKTQGLGSLGQEFQQLEPLLVGQLGPAAGRLAVAQSLGTIGLGPTEPLSDAPLVTPRASAMRC